MTNRFIETYVYIRVKVFNPENPHITTHKILIFPCFVLVSNIVSDADGRM